jgi:3-dehydroquinate synthase
MNSATLTAAKPETVAVDLGERSYEVRIGRGLLARAGEEIVALAGKRRVAILTDETVAARHLPALQAALAAQGIDAPALALPAGEATKRWERLGEAVEWLLAQKIERKDLVIALGGGVIGDLAGFASAILRRGVRFVQIPTTLLAQVDSSVGGKTGINSPQGKNLIGAFHQPSLVLADIDVLTTLTPRDFRAGYGEVAKYGLLGDEGFFDWLEVNAAGLAGDAALRQRAVRHSVQIKADIVQRDETEQGDRALLNLGHTFGHALLLHGEGVAIGCTLAFELSAKMGLCSQEAPSRVAAHFAAMGLPSRIGDIPGHLPDDEALIALMGQDKKVQDGKLRFILAHGIGRAFVTDAVDPQALRQSLAQSRL